MRILVLGGTQFLSKRIAEVAVGAGHDVICAARGQHGDAPDGATFVRWDRAGAVPSELAALHPDAVVDVTGTPIFAQQAVVQWPDARWVFISTLNVYADMSQPGGTVADTALVEPIDDGDPSANPETYGAMKVACENAVLTGAASALVLRPGLIVGPGDSSGRFAYWPIHAAQAVLDGGDLLVPGEPGDPVQFIDVSDLARWVVRVIEDGVSGCFDALGSSMTRADFVAGLLDGVGAGINLVSVPSHWLLDHGVKEWWGPGSIPLWVADAGEAAMMTRDVTASLEAGLVIRPVAETVRDTLDWLQSVPNPVVTGLTRPEELRLLAQFVS